MDHRKKLTDKEKEAVEKFFSEHRKTCFRPSTVDCNNQLFIDYIETGIGLKKVAKCSICGKTEDITDYDCW